MAKLKKKTNKKNTLKLTKLYPGLNKGGLGLPISQLSQMALNMTQINTFQLPSGTSRPWGKERTIYCRGQRPRRLGIYTLLILLQSTRGRRECSRVRDHPHTCPDPAEWMMPCIFPQTYVSDTVNPLILFRNQAAGSKVSGWMSQGRREALPLSATQKDPLMNSSTGSGQPQTSLLSREQRC